MTNDFDQIISSAAQICAGRPSTTAGMPCANHSSSTFARLLPLAKMRSTSRSPRVAFASQCAKAIATLDAGRLEGAP